MFRKTYRTTYSYKGEQFEHRFSIDSRPADLEMELRRSAAYVQTCLRSQFEEITIVSWVEVPC